MFVELINLIYAGCTNEWEYLLATFLFILILDCIFSLVNAVVGGARS